MQKITMKMAGVLLLFSGVLVFGQAARFDSNVYTINSSYPLPGGLYPVLSYPGATIAVCNAPATGFTVIDPVTHTISNGCTNYAATYTNAAESGTCSAPTQLTRTDSTTCVGTADAEGGFGVWMAGGSYQYTVTTVQGSYGPYDFSVGAGGTQSLAISTNGTPNLSQAALAFTDTSSVKFTNPSAGLEEATVNVTGGLQNFTPDPLGTQSVVVPFTAVVNNLDGGSPCFATSNTTSGQLGFIGGGSNLGCEAPPGPSITWSSAVLPSYVTAANVTAIYAVGTVGFSGNAQALNLKCSDPTPNTTALMNGGTIDGTDTGVLKAYDAQLTWATGASIGTISCVANVAANAGGASNPLMNISNIQLRVYYTGTAPPASTKLNITSPLYLNTALNALGVAAINLAGSGDGGVIGLLPNANLANPSMTINGTTCTLGGSCTPSGGGTTTNALTAAATGGAAPGTSFNGSAAVTFDYHSFGAAPLASPTFTGTVTIPALDLSSITGTQCLHSVSGVVSGTGTDCGSGSGGVTQITGPSSTVTGAMTFTGAGVSQSGNTFTFSGGGGGGTVFCTPNAQTGTAYTLVLTDGTASGAACIGTVTMTNAANNTVTVPPNSSVALPIPDEIDLIQLGAGQTCFAAGAGVTLTTPTSLCARAQNSTIGIRQISANTWIVFGDTQ